MSGPSVEAPTWSAAPARTSTGSVPGSTTRSTSSGRAGRVRAAARSSSSKDAWNDRHRRVVAALDDLAAALRDTERDVLTTDEAQAAGYHHDLGRLGG